MLVGDVVGRPGRRAVEKRLQQIKEEHDIDFCVLNCENAAAGFG
ncbi:MAG: YmdB family metallophosphoesterase, partial [Armatimonadota bacterium]